MAMMYFFPREDLNNPVNRLIVELQGDRREAAGTAHADAAL
jgi:hypothetical protein